MHNLINTDLNLLYFPKIVPDSGTLIDGLGVVRRSINDGQCALATIGADSTYTAIITRVNEQYAYAYVWALNTKITKYNYINGWTVES